MFTWCLLGMVGLWSQTSPSLRTYLLMAKSEPIAQLKHQFFDQSCFVMCLSGSSLCDQAQAQLELGGITVEPKVQLFCLCIFKCVLRKPLRLLGIRRTI